VSGDVVWIDVLPSLAGFAGKLQQGTTQAGADAGKASGSAWGKAFGNSAGGAATGVAAELEKNEKRARKAVDDATVAIGKARNSQREAAARTLLAEQSLSDAIAKYGEGSARAEAASLRLEVARDKEATAAKGVVDAETALRAAANEATEATNQLESAEADLASGMKDTTDRAEEQRAAWGDLKDTLKTGAVATAAAFAAVVAAGKGLYDVGATFDDVSDTIRTQTGATGTALSALEDSVKTVATSVPTDFETATDAVAGLHQRLGLTGSTLETVASQVVEAGNMIGEALNLDTVTGSLNAFQVSGEDTSAALDSLFRVSQATGIGMNDLAQRLEAQAPAVQALGFSYDDAAAMIGNLDQAGLNSQAIMAAMSKGLVTLAKDGEEPAAAFQRVVDEIGGFIDAGDQASALDLAAQVFGTRGATQFIGALQSGALALDDLSAASGASSDTILGAAADTHDFAEAWEMFKNDVLVQVEPIASRVFGLIGEGMSWLRETGLPVLKDIGGEVIDRVGPAFEAFGGFITDKLVPGFKSTVEWVQKNQDWLKAVGVTVGTVVAIWGAYKLATAAWTVATNAAKAAQLAFNVVMSANPVMLVVTAIAALVAGLVYFFTQTDTGRQIWESFTSALSTAWQATVDAITTAWTWLGDTLQAGWQWIDENVVQRAVAGWQWIVDAFTTAKDAIGDAWSALGDGLQAGWQWIVDHVVTPYVAGWQWMWDKVVAVKDAVLDAWGRVKSGLKAGWDWIRENVVNAYANAWDNIREKFNRVKDAVLDAWGSVKSGLKAGFDWIVDHVVDPLKNAVGKIGDAFGAAKDVIGAAWDKVKEAAAKPVNFVIETVYTKGIKGTFDKIASSVGLSLRLPTITPLHFATGGVLPGWTPGRDVHKFVSPTGGRLDLSGGEAIMRPEFTRAVGGPAGVQALNAAAIAGALGRQAFAGGGVFGWLGSAASGVGHFLSSVGSSIKDAVVNVGAFLANPLEGIKELIEKPVRAMLKNIGGGDVGTMLSELPLQSVAALARKVVGLVDDIAGANGAWSLPSRGPITSGYGARKAPLSGASTFHAGIDIAGGGPTYAAAAGTVERTGWNVFGARSGIGILLDHGDGIKTRYMHNPVNGVVVSPGDRVKAGQHIGAQGATGNVTGTHLHFEVHKGGTTTDPAAFLRSKGVKVGTYDTGGVLPPGDTLVRNLTGRPEMVLNPAQTARQDRPIDLSASTIDDLARRIADHLGVVAASSRQVQRAVALARTTERMG